jgi:hypothetical protein
MADNDQLREWLHTVPTKLLLSEAARRSNAKRKVHSGGSNGGRPKVLKPCPKCGDTFGAREMAKHIPKCA